MYLALFPRCKYPESIFETQFLKPIGQVKKYVFPNWCLQAVCEVKFYFQYRHFVNCFLSHLRTQSWSSWCIDPYWNTHTSHKPHGLHIPLYICSWLISHITLMTQVSMHPRFLSRAQCQQLQQTPPHIEEPGGSSQPYFPRANPTGQEAAPFPSSQQTLQATTSFPTYQHNF